MSNTATSAYDFEATAIDGSAFPFTAQRGCVLLVVNTASACGFTSQFAGLEELWRTYGERGLTVIGFPCNQFGSQDPGSDIEIGTFCRSKYFRRSWHSPRVVVSTRRGPQRRIRCFQAALRKQART